MTTQQDTINQETEAQDLNTMFPAPHVRTINGASITFKRVVVADLTKFKAFVSPILADDRVTQLIQLVGDDDTHNKVQAKVYFEDLIIDHLPDVLGAICCMSDADIHWLSSQDSLDVIFEVAKEAVEVNKDYFLLRLVGKVAQTISAGDLLLQDSSAMATTSETSPATA